LTTRDFNQRSQCTDLPALTAGAALFLDFDGTLVDLTVRPEQVRTADSLPSLLMALQERLEGAVAIITGRRLEDIDQRLAPTRLAGAGVHGAELRLRPGNSICSVKVEGVAALVAGLRARFVDDPRILVEDKGVGVSLHFRLAPERAAECRRALREAVDAAALATLQIMEGNAVVEARPANVNKGRALNILLDAAPFRGRQPFFIGDDRTDEDGFAAVIALGGIAIKVGPGDTVAPHRLTGVAEVHAWLRAGLHG
jgi:trehalose 6-phosphate phosphatase